MNKETIKNTISFFLNCQKLIPKPKRLRYGHFKSLLHSLINEEEFNRILASAFNLAEHYFLVAKYKHPYTVLSDISGLAIKIKENLSPAQKLIFMTVLLKVVKLNKQEKNVNLKKAFFCLAEINSYDHKQAEKIWDFFLSEDMKESDYSDSLLITNEMPDYCQVVDGLKVLYNPAYTFKLWIKNIKSVNNMLFKILEYNEMETLSGIAEGDLLSYNKPLQKLLGRNDISIDELAKRILSEKELMPRVEIAETERTPKVILNAAESRIEIDGISMCLQPNNFFRPVMHWLDKMQDRRPKGLDLHVNLSFFNTYTSKTLLNIFHKAIAYEKTGTDVRIYWYYEEGDSEIHEAGTFYESILDKELIYVITRPRGMEAAVEFAL